MKKYFLILPIAAILIIIASIGFSNDDKKLKETFDLDATFYPDEKKVHIQYRDSSKDTKSATLEILGMKESYQKKFSDSEFLEVVEFDSEPKHGWKIHPIVLNVDHGEFGVISLKTEIHEQGKPAPQIIFGRP
ncbi:MAG: hypothetical protein GWN01_11740 [Nitrosopumilaceae archaeon]|nr:hypothetical protein [Nitrosopumilaceae archaeon]NIU01547.1 hypothetical protein [Nitrosopumilaceae archaeon]NIU87966.1 hypothetical protein [Nitrosopumilaceae archaeon]NIV66238.1 hypothetical protein [Nitrosopumilaceae archaeon]NIX62149.1 hypothetical protein [Nitrosopumilaceae archaeon]